MPNPKAVDLGPGSRDEVMSFLVHPVQSGIRRSPFNVIQSKTKPWPFAAFPPSRVQNLRCPIPRLLAAFPCHFGTEQFAFDRLSLRPISFAAARTPRRAPPRPTAAWLPKTAGPLPLEGKQGDGNSNPPKLAKVASCRMCKAQATPHGQKRNRRPESREKDLRGSAHASRLFGSPPAAPCSARTRRQPAAAAAPRTCGPAPSDRIGSELRLQARHIPKNWGGLPSKRETPPPIHQPRVYSSEVNSKNPMPFIFEPQPLELRGSFEGWEHGK